MSFWDYRFLLITTIVLMLLGILFQVSIGIIYQRLIQATDTVLGADSNLMKQCRMKFIQAYQLNGGVANISVFVDKFLNRLRFCGMSMGFIRQLSKQLVMAGVLVAGFGICKGIVDGSRLSALLPFYIIVLFGMYLYFSIASIVDASSRRKILKVNLIDYLENHIAERLNRGMEIKDRLQEEKKAISPEATSKMGGFSKEDALELEELLRSFMV